ncbi:hypothetical protein KR222_005947, partial [Zaprionus bogoriensis]
INRALRNLQINCELYPCRRQTEFYRTPQPRSSTQTRKAEHPTDRLNPYALRNTNASVLPYPRIPPPRTSGMRVHRNSYFS